VPVDGRMLGQFVGDEDADLVAFDRLDGRTRRLAVVAQRFAFMPSANSRTTGSATRWNSFQVAVIRHGSVQPFSVTTGR